MMRADPSLEFFVMAIAAGLRADKGGRRRHRWWICAGRRARGIDYRARDKKHRGYQRYSAGSNNQDPANQRRSQRHATGL